MMDYITIALLQNLKTFLKLYWEPLKEKDAPYGTAFVYGIDPIISGLG